jgi:hypothetical protein
MTQPNAFLEQHPSEMVAFPTDGDEDVEPWHIPNVHS